MVAATLNKEGDTSLLPLHGPVCTRKFGLRSGRMSEQGDSQEDSGSIHFSWKWENGPEKTLQDQRESSMNGAGTQAS